MNESGGFSEALSAEERKLTEEALRRDNYDLGHKAEEAERKAATLKVVADEKETALQEAYRELSLYKAPKGRKPRWALAKKKETGPERATIIAFLSDTHYGEVVRAEEMGDYNKYNMSIAEIRTKAFFEKVISASRKYIGGVEYDGIVLPLGGDLVSGTIHEELSETNELTTYDTILAVLPWLEYGIANLLEVFGKVHVVSAPGNHGRDSKKPRHKLRAAHNADTLLSRLLAFHMQGIDGLTFDIPEAMDVDFDVYGHVFSMEHGDNFRFSGTSEIGAYGPVKRGTLRKSRQRQGENRPFEYLLVGHFHQYIPAWTQGIIMNGSVKGYDEYAQSWKFSVEPAQQGLLVVTPDKGVAQALPIIVQDRMKEGW